MRLFHLPFILKERKHGKMDADKNDCCKICLSVLSNDRLIFKQKSIYNMKSFESNRYISWK